MLLLQICSLDGSQAMVHHETTSGILNPMHEIGEIVAQSSPDCSLIVDSMSAFGAHPVDMRRSHVAYLVSSSNKTIEGVPGFAFVLCNRQKLLAEGGSARSVSLDLLAQWTELQASGQFRFTPPTHTLLAFRQALIEHRKEGGSARRLARYQANEATLVEGLKQLGFETYVDAAQAGSIISTFVCPDDPKFDFDDFYADLYRQGFVIYPGKLTGTPCFRIGTIGQLYPRDMEELVDAIRGVLTARGIRLPVTQLPC